MTDRQYLNRALELAAEGRARTSPNPMVGAVLVNNGDIVTVTPATAAVNIFHQFAGQPSDGSQQHSSFSFDANGNTFGMSADGGTKDKGFLYYIPAGSRSSERWRGSARR